MVGFDAQIEHDSMTDRIPDSPVFLYSAESHWIDLRRTAPTTERTFRRFGGKQYYTTAYDANQIRWKAHWETVPKDTTIWTHLATSILARKLKDHRVDVPVQWTHDGDYPFAELRGICVEAVNHDDDILTQFVERSDLLKRLDRCETFHELIDVWEWLSVDRSFKD